MESRFLLALGEQEYLAALAIAGSEAFFNKLLIVQVRFMGENAKCASEKAAAAFHPRNGVYSEGILGRSGRFLRTSGNIRLNASPLALSGSSCGESFGRLPFLLGEESGGVTSSGIITTPYTSTN
jgi:hypothetical protein